MAIHLLNSAVCMTGVAFVLTNHMHPVIHGFVRAAVQQPTTHQHKYQNDSFHSTLQGLGMKIWE